MGKPSLEPRIQQEIERKWHPILLDNSSSEDFACAYDELHLCLDQNEENSGIPSGGLEEFIIERVNTHKHVLEVGCGDGLLSFALAKQSNLVVGMDISHVMLHRAKKSNFCHPGPVNLRFMVGDARQLPFDDDSFDYIISQNLIEHLSPADGRRHLLEAQRILKSTGCYLLHVPNRITKGYRSAGLHLWMYSLEDMIRLVSSLGYKALWIEPKLERWLGIKREIPASWLAPVFWYERILDTVHRAFLPGHDLIIKDHRLSPTVLIAAYKSELPATN